MKRIKLDMETPRNAPTREIDFHIVYDLIPEAADDHNMTATEDGKAATLTLDATEIYNLVEDIINGVRDNS